MRRKLVNNTIFDTPDEFHKLLADIRALEEYKTCLMAFIVHLLKDRFTKEGINIEDEMDTFEMGVLANHCSFSGIDDCSIEIEFTHPGPHESWNKDKPIKVKVKVPPHKDTHFALFRKDKPE